MFLSNRKLVYALMALLYVIGVRPLFAETQDPNAVVAIVNDVNVLYKEIKVNPKLVQLAYTEGLNEIRLDEESDF
ncbi:hypothetical protein ES703_120945 [subsurface metagenome]